MGQFFRHDRVRFLIVLLSVLLATLARSLLDPMLGSNQPYIFYFAAVIVSAWAVDGRAALLALALGFLAANYFFIEPRGSFGIVSQVQLIGTVNYFVVGLTIVAFASRMRAAQRRAEHNAREARREERSREAEARRRHAAEAAAQLRERQFTTLVENSPDVVGRLDRELRFLYVSPAVARFGVEAEGLLGRRCEDSGLPCGLCQPLSERAEALLAGDSVRFEFIQGADGDRRHHEVRLIPERNADEAVASILLIVSDITERRRAEDALRASEERLNAILQATTAYIYQLDAGNRYEHINRRVEEMLGLSVDEVRGKTMVELLGPGIAAAFAANNARVIAENRVLEFEETAILPHGERTFTSVKAPLRDAGGRVTGLVGISTDITDRKRMEEQLREADRRKDEFLATLAHELRNPLAPMRSALEILKLAGAGGERAAQARAILERQIGQMVRLIDDLLDLSRITRDKLELRLENTELGAIVAHAVESCRPLVDGRAHELKLHPAPEPIPLRADPVRMVQVFSNLITNACKYSPPGGRIDVFVERGGDGAVVRVRDRGIGIPADMLERIFEMFTQVDHSLERSYGGLGIGLALAKRLVELHRGSIGAASDGPGRGSEFVVRLPVSGAAHDAPPRQSVLPAPPPRRILIADDNPDAAQSLALLLGLRGNEVYVADDGAQALELVERHRPDVVLLDIGMPRLNGYDAARAIRGRPDGAGTLLIALTGWGQAQDRLRSREAGFDHHLVKPVETERLMRLLAEADGGAAETRDAE